MLPGAILRDLTHDFCALSVPKGAVFTLCTRPSPIAIHYDGQMLQNHFITRAALLFIARREAIRPRPAIAKLL